MEANTFEQYILLLKSFLFILHFVKNFVKSDWTGRNIMLDRTLPNLLVITEKVKQYKKYRKQI